MRTVNGPILVGAFPSWTDCFVGAGTFERFWVFNNVTGCFGVHDVGVSGPEYNRGGGSAFYQ